LSVPHESQIEIFVLRQQDFLFIFDKNEKIFTFEKNKYNVLHSLRISIKNHS